MTTPAHDSVAYLPARPRLARLRKEADQLNLCLPYPTLDLCSGGGAAARFAAWRIGARHTRLLFEDWMGLHSAPVDSAAKGLRACVSTQSETRANPITSHSRDSASGDIRPIVHF